MTSNYSSEHESEGALRPRQQRLSLNGHHPADELEVIVQLETGPTLPARRPPLQDDCLLHGQPPAAYHPHVVVAQSALAQIRDHALSDVGVEVGGVLLGSAYQHNDRTFVEIKAAIPALTTDHGPSHFTFTADAWVQLHVDRAAYPDYEIIGWFHTHPDLGVFFSDDDEVVQRAAFTLPWHVALVIDPLRNTASFFGWDREQIVALPGFYELIPATAGPVEQVPRSLLTWKVDVDRAAQQMQNSPPQSVELPAISPWVGALLGGAALIVSIIALIVALGSR